MAGLSRSQQLNAGILPSVQVCLLTYQRVPPPHKGKPQILIGPDNEYEFAWQSYEVDLGEGGGAVAFKKIAYTNKHASAVRVLWRVSRVWHAVSLMPPVPRVFCLACLSLPSVSVLMRAQVLKCVLLRKARGQRGPQAIQDQKE